MNEIQQPGYRLGPTPEGRLPFPHTLATGAAVSMMLAGLVEVGGSKLFHRRPDTTVTFATEPNDDGSEAFYALPGLGVGLRNAKLMANGVEAATKRPTACVYAGYSRENPFLQAVPNAVRKSIIENRITNVGFYAHSMGGIVLPHVIERLPNDTEVSHIIFDCSPSGMDTVSHELAASIGKRLAHTRIPGGMLTVPTISAISEYLHQARVSESPSLLDRTVALAKGAAKQFGPNRVTPGTWKEQYRAIEDSDYDVMQRSYSNLGPDTPIAYLMPENSEADTTVHTREAAQALAKTIGINIDELHIPGGGHGITQDTAHSYLPIIREWIESLD